MKCSRKPTFGEENHIFSSGHVEFMVPMSQKKGAVEEVGKAGLLM